VCVGRPNVLRAIAVECSVITASLDDGTQCVDAVQSRTPAVILETDEQLTVDAAREFPDRSALTTQGHDVDQTSPQIRRRLRHRTSCRVSGDRAHGEHVRAVAHPRHERRPSQEVGGEALRSILSPTEEIERRVGTSSPSPTLTSSASSHDVGPLYRREAVAPVAVGAQEVG